MDASDHRAALQAARRIVVKVGTRILVDERGRPDEERLGALVDQLAALHAGGREVVLVSSGAIGAGLESLGLGERPTALPELQMAAAIGQVRLLHRYATRFAAHGCTTGQVLLTHADLRDRRRHLNASNTMLALLRHRVVPIVNENDVVSVEEIQFGDNDELAALVAMLIGADLLILLTSVGGLLSPTDGPPDAWPRVPYVAAVTENVRALARRSRDTLSSGGMDSKLDAARTATAAGTPVVIASGHEPQVLARVLAGEDVGTLFKAAPGRLAGRPRKQWLAFFQKPEGAIIVDARAAEAVAREGRSLLAVGVVEIEGEFEPGALVVIRDPDGHAIAQGLASYGSRDVRRIRGRRTEEIAAVLGARDYDEVVHRDHLVVLAEADT